MRDAVVTAAGDRIRWAELPGQGPARVYLHGLGASSPAYFAAVAAHPLLAGRRSLLVDLLGFGLSDRPTDFGYTFEAHADAVAAALESAGVEQAEVVAHSMGGCVAVLLAARHPRLVSRLVLVDSPLDRVIPRPPAPGRSGLAWFTEEEFLAGGWRDVRAAVGPHWWSTMRLAGLEALHRSGMEFTREVMDQLRGVLVGLSLPRTFLWPERDGTFPRAEQLAASGVRMVPVPDCGHNIMLDNPEGFARAVAEALAGDGAPGGVAGSAVAGREEELCATLS
ncbi:alpha/beta hydrolase [Streptomyces sp. NPDC051940]|uniref:alpha/beta fold hydrolase n=1 Tax=Streptomyces sp. NPDC051940 TaxID=3155675 RepID=UPI00341DD001